MPCPHPVCRRASTSPTRMFTSRDYPSRSWQSFAGPRRSGGMRSQLIKAGLTTAAIGDSAAGQIEAGRFSMINMDAPQHTRMRKIIARGFTPRAVGRLREELTDRAQRIARAASAERSGDFVQQVACELPLQAIAGLIGVPLEDRTKLFQWTNEMIGDEDPEFEDVEALSSAGELMFYAMRLAAEKATNPGDDIVSTLI